MVPGKKIVNTRCSSTRTPGMLPGPATMQRRPALEVAVGSDDQVHSESGWEGNGGAHRGARREEA